MKVLPRFRRNTIFFWDESTENLYLGGYGNSGVDIVRIDAYEAIRRPATSKIVLSNRGEGPDIILQIAEDRAPNGFEKIEDVISQEEMEMISSRYKKTAGVLSQCFPSRIRNRHASRAG